MVLCEKKYLEDYKFYVGWDVQTLSHTSNYLIYGHKQVNFSFFLSVRSLENRECFQLIADRATQVGQGFC